MPTGAGADVGDVSHITWRRPADFFPPAEGSALSYDVFVGGVEPNDIRQGQLADCWSVDSSVTMSAVHFFCRVTTLVRYRCVLHRGR